MKKYVSLILKLIIVVSSVLGVILSMQLKSDSFMGGMTALLYFTIQSNIWIGLVCLLFLIIYIVELISKKTILKNWMYILKYIFTVSITLTGLVFCFFLAPVMPTGAWTINNVLTHVVVPVCSIVDMFIDTFKFKYKNKHVLISIIPPAYYLVFAIICYVNNIKFADGQNFPYFFLNFNSPAGIFGFSNMAPYFMGSFYWIIIMILIVVAFALLYKTIINKIIDKNKNSSN